MDRLARSLIDLEQIVSDLTARKVSVEFVKERLTFTPDATADPFATFQRQLIGAVAELERSSSANANAKASTWPKHAACTRAAPAASPTNRSPTCARQQPPARTRPSSRPTLGSRAASSTTSSPATAPTRRSHQRHAYPRPTGMNLPCRSQRPRTHLSQCKNRHSGSSTCTLFIRLPARPLWATPPGRAWDLLCDLGCDIA
ncbi:recombinase family protein [Agromyces sp. NPDC056379]|uniref:recombinase family protein n=1 Tax=Agromyces sp. NPDC056379 TaxID=3345802 RepID=UPI0035DAE462